MLIKTHTVTIQRKNPESVFAYVHKKKSYHKSITFIAPTYTSFVFKRGRIFRQALSGLCEYAIIAYRMGP